LVIVPVVPVATLYLNFNILVLFAGTNIETAPEVGFVFPPSNNKFPVAPLLGNA
jgi:hypothetical protein